MTHRLVISNDSLGNRCPGECTGVEVRLENGVLGTIFSKQISSHDQEVDPTTRMKIDQVVQARIIDIKYDINRGTSYHHITHYDSYNMTHIYIQFGKRN